MFRRLPREFAMSVNGILSYDQVVIPDLVAEAVSWPLSRRLAEMAVIDTLDTLEAIRDAVADGVVQHELLSEAISDRTGNLLAGKAAH